MALWGKCGHWPLLLSRLSLASLQAKALGFRSEPYEGTNSRLLKHQMANFLFRRSLLQLAYHMVIASFSIEHILESGWNAFLNSLSNFAKRSW